MSTFVEADHPRAKSGEFVDKPQSSPEFTLEKKIAALGGGPAVDNLFASAWDEDDWRPFRRGLPLRETDDDEFFDAPKGSILSIAGEGASRTLWRRDSAGWDWVNQETGETVEAGALWASLFDDKGIMSSAVINLPSKVGYSDRSGYGDLNDTPQTTEWGLRRMGKRVRMVELTMLDGDGNTLVTALPDGDRGRQKLAVEATSDGLYIKISTGAGSTRSIDMSRTEVFERRSGVLNRKSSIVLRYKTDAGMYSELVYQAA